MLLPDNTHGLWPASRDEPEAMVKMPEMVVVAVLVAVTVSDPEPSPKVKLLKFQEFVPPKYPVPSNIKVPPVQLRVPLPVASPP